MGWMPTSEKITQFAAEMGRRNVFRAAAGYAIAASVVMQAADILLSAFGASPWVLQSLILLMSIGFIPVLAFAWKYEVTSKGIQLESEVAVDGADPRQSRKFDIAVVALVLVAVALLVVDRTTSENDAPMVETTAPSPGAIPFRSIAIKPFADLSADADEGAYFADGLTEEVLNRLVQIPEFQVAGRTSSFIFRSSEVDHREMGRVLGVNYILDGSVRRVEGRVRVTAQLVRTEDGFNLWSANYDRELADLFAVQDEIASSVAAALDILMDEDRLARMRATGVRNVEAWVEYQKGLQLHQLAHGVRSTIPSLSEANAHFQRARELVPDFADAYYHEADLYIHILLETDPTVHDHVDALGRLHEVLAAAYRHARDPQRRALIDVDITIFGTDWRGLGATLERAFTVSQCVDNQHTLQHTIGLGRADDIVAFYARLRECDPFRATNHIYLALAAVWAGRPELSIEVTEAAIERFGAHPYLYAVLTGAKLATGRLDEALLAARRVDINDQGVGSALGMALAAGGDADGARAHIERWSAIHGGNTWTDISLPAWLGDRATANEVAAAIDARPAGPALLLTAIRNCGCGAPFDLTATPHLQARLSEAQASWPPRTVIRFPLKDW